MLNWYINTFKKEEMILCTGLDVTTTANYKSTKQEQFKKKAQVSYYATDRSHSTHNKSYPLEFFDVN